VQKNFQNVGSQLSYIFNNRNPVQFTLRDAPFWQSNRTRFDAFYAQDQWTRGRLTLQGGVRCEHAWSWFPEGENGVVAWLTTYRSLVAYTIPKIDVLVSGSMRSTPGVQPSTVNAFVATNGAPLSANYNVTSAILQQSSLARLLAFAQTFQTVDLLLPGQKYGDRVNSLDMRVAKVVRIGRYRTNVGFDFYNLVNKNTGTAFNQVYDVASNGATWVRPTTILAPRFARFNVTVNF
jgi:hypothetical protein